MNVITNLIKKHITINFINVSSLLFLLGGLLWGFIFPHFNVHATLFIFLYFCIIPISAYQNTDVNQTNTHLPVKRSQIIASIYISNFLILSVIILLGLFSVFLTFGFDTSLGQAVTLITICIPILLLSFLIPLGFKIGMMWLQVVSVGLCTALGVFTMLSIADIMNGEILLNFNYDLTHLIAPSIIICLVLYLFSMKLSIHLFKKKEFS
ncbi:ABC-2 transporter permease [uncultured Clostridium sp.]|jgi:MFS family permease|uniref:ABC-2 transporter permease n=1 Tax=uncultured Clostridium sp. TaxID=59620 RepID=UPI0026101CB9|nr:ABC-2 transporter permease [uncultured Clostridium sp.]